MMNLEEELNEAAFWHEWICLGCAKRGEAGEMIPCCPECEAQTVEAAGLQRFVAGLDAERAAGF